MSGYARVLDSSRYLYPVFVP